MEKATKCECPEAKSTVEEVSKEYTRKLGKSGKSRICWVVCRIRTRVPSPRVASG